jgi:Tol biopolymer transport system component
MHFSADGALIFICLDGGAGLVSSKTRKQRTLIKKFEGVTHGAISQDGKKLAYVIREMEDEELKSRKVYVIDPAANEKKVVLNAPELLISDLTFSADGKHLYYVVFDPSEKKPVEKIYRIAL